MGLSSEQIDALESIQSLRVSGAISNNEFEDLKAKLLDPVGHRTFSKAPRAKEPTPVPGSIIEKQHALDDSSGWWFKTNRNIYDSYCRVQAALCIEGLQIDTKHSSGWGLRTKQQLRGVTRRVEIQFEALRNDEDLAWTRIEITALRLHRMEGATYADGTLLNVQATLNKCLSQDFLERRTNGDLLVGLADFSSNDVRGLDFRNVFFFGADLHGCDLNGVNLFNCDLSYADLFGANLTGADLSNANLTGTNITDVLWDETTRWPEGFTPPPSR